MRRIIRTPLPRSLFLLGASALVVLLACGGGFNERDPAAFGSLRVDVTNDRAPRVRIYLLPEEGDAVLLGGAPVEGTTTFRIEPDEADARYRLRADLGRGRELISDAFVPAELQGVTWVLSTNDLTLQGT